MEDGRQPAEHIPEDGEGRDLGGDRDSEHDLAHRQGGTGPPRQAAGERRAEGDPGQVDGQDHREGIDPRPEVEEQDAGPDQLGGQRDETEQRRKEQPVPGRRTAGGGRRRGSLARRREPALGRPGDGGHEQSERGRRRQRRLLAESRQGDEGGDENPGHGAEGVGGVQTCHPASERLVVPDALDQQRQRRPHRDGRQREEEPGHRESPGERQAPPGERLGAEARGHAAQRVQDRHRGQRHERRDRLGGRVEAKVVADPGRPAGHHRVADRHPTHVGGDDRGRRPQRVADHQPEGAHPDHLVGQRHHPGHHEEDRHQRRHATIPTTSVESSEIAAPAPRPGGR